MTEYVEGCMLREEVVLTPCKMDLQEAKELAMILRGA